MPSIRWYSPTNYMVSQPRRLQSDIHLRLNSRVLIAVWIVLGWRFALDYPWTRQRNRNARSDFRVHTFR
jgi:hypothetical protein